jgi:hypothetical protein
MANCSRREELSVRQAQKTPGGKMAAALEPEKREKDDRFRGNLRIHLVGGLRTAV